MDLDEALDVARVTHSTADGGPLDALRVLSTYALWARGELDQLRLELHRERMASLRRAHRAVGGAVHHLDGDVTNNDLANLVLVDPADNAARMPR